MTWLNYPGHVWAILAGTLVCAAVFFGFIRLFQVRRLHAPAICCAGLMQGLCALGLLVILWNPSAIQEIPRSVRNRVLVVMDTSQSMSIQDTDQGDRLNAAVQAFKIHAQADSDARPMYQVLGLDSTLYACTTDTLTRWGTHSRVGMLKQRLGEWMTDANETGQETDVTGLVLFSDGQFEDVGSGVSDMVWPQGFKAVVVGVGSALALADVGVVDVHVPGRVPKGSLCPIDVTVTSTQDVNEPLALDLILDDVVIEQALLEPGQWTAGEPQQQRVTFQWPMQQTGQHVLGARISHMDGDRNSANDEAWTVLDVMEQQTSRVLLYTRRASLQVGKIRRVLEMDSQVVLDVCLDVIKDRRTALKAGQSSGAVSFPYEPNEFKVYDLIVLVTSEPSVWDETQVRNLYGFVAEQGGGLIVVADSTGQGLFTDSRPMITRLLPVITTDMTTGPALGGLAPSREALDRRWFQADSFGFQDGPVLAWPLGQLKPAAWDLARVNDQPALSLHRVGKGHVCVVGLSKLFQLYREDRSGGVLSTLFSALVRAAAPQPDTASGLCVFAERVPGLADRIWVTARIEAQADRFVDDATVLVTLNGQVWSLSAMGQGWYRVEVPYSGPHSLVIHAEAQAQGGYLGTCDTAVRLPSVRDEMSDIQLNKSGLKDLSKAIHGEYVHVNDVDRSVFDRFDARKTLQPEIEVDSLWPRWMVLCVLSILLCASWMIRRSLGMG